MYIYIYISKVATIFRQRTQRQVRQQDENKNTNAAKCSIVSVYHHCANTCPKWHPVCIVTLDICTSLTLSIYIYAYIHIHMHACMHTYVRTYTQTYTDAYAYIRVYIYVYICIYICIHIYILKDATSTLYAPACATGSAYVHIHMYMQCSRQRYIQMQISKL